MTAKQQIPLVDQWKPTEDDIYFTNAKDVKHITKKDKFAICLGNEAKGISKEVLDNMDENVKIAMNNDVESLNVSIAAGIIMYEMME